MTQNTPVLLLDDGELDDVRALFEELGASFLHLRGGDIPRSIPAPSRLFVATPRRAVLAGQWPQPRRARGDASVPSKICVVAEDSNTLRSMLRRMDFDLLIRRPVHPYALRLVLLRALYLGEERRREERLPVGCEVTLRSGLRRRRATLAELSKRGCRLLCEQPLPVGSRLSVQIPRQATGERSLSLPAKVIRTREAEQEPECRHVLALGFESLSPRATRRLSQLLAQRAGGPARLAKAVVSASPPRSRAPEVGGGDRDLPLAGPAAEEERRKHRRVARATRAVSLDDEAQRTLVGRDLSRGGMRIDPQPELTEGEELRLAIYGNPTEDPVVVRARVVRDDGTQGFGLQFEDLSPESGARLETLVANLPAVEALQAGETEAMGSVVSQILDWEGP